MNMHVEPPAVKDQIAHVHELLDWYYDTHIARDGASDIAGRYRSFLRHLKDHFGEMRVEDITQEAGDEYIRLRSAGEIGKPAKLNSIDLELRILKAAVNRGIRKRRVPRWAMFVIDTGKGWVRRDRYLTRVEAARFLRAARKYRERTPRGAFRLSPEEVFVWLALYTAQRKTKICTLKWFPQVDFAARVADFVDRSRPQNKKRAGRQPMHPIIFRVLRRWFRDRADERGETVLPQGFKPGLACKEICRLSKVEGVTPHVFRHTFITWRVAAGVPLHHISMVTGVSITTLMMNYAHLMPITGHDVMMAGKAKTVSGARI